ncbi:MAG: SpoIID/LytB domain-containing protein [Cyanobacteriota bacterium]|nr:SpoIID/LytB domain-containing protein [Cyanobacteriota bacterium]
MVPPWPTLAATATMARRPTTGSTPAMLRPPLLPMLLALPLPLLLAPEPLRAGPPEPVVRVLLQEAPQVQLAAVAVPARLNDGGGRVLLTLQPGERLMARLEADQLVLVRQTTGQAPDAPADPLRLQARAVWFDPQISSPGTAAVGLAARSYRGRLELRPASQALQVINHVGVENYLPGVVASEMPASWPQAALRAQAIAARTYALRQRRPQAAFDLKATTASQVYGGLDAETESTRQAVAATRTLVLTHGGALIEAVFHSSSGGRTENSGELWAGQLPYLVSVSDDDRHSPVHRWQERYDASQLLQAFPETGGLTDLEVLATSSTGRVRQLRISGPQGSIELSGAELRRRLRLRSTLASFTVESAPVAPLEGTVPGAESPTPPLASLLVEGRGFGHGVGMSQWGAHAMALRGDTADRILQHFYRGVVIRPYSAP